MKRLTCLLAALFMSACGNGKVLSLLEGNYTVTATIVEDSFPGGVSTGDVLEGVSWDLTKDLDDKKIWYLWLDFFNADAGTFTSAGYEFVNEWLREDGSVQGARTTTLHPDTEETFTGSLVATWEDDELGSLRQEATLTGTLDFEFGGNALTVAEEDPYSSRAFR